MLTLICLFVFVCLSEFGWVGLWVLGSGCGVLFVF